MIHKPFAIRTVAITKVCCISFPSFIADPTKLFIEFYTIRVLAILIHLIFWLALLTWDATVFTYISYVRNICIFIVIMFFPLLLLFTTRRRMVLFSTFKAKWNPTITFHSDYIWKFWSLNNEITKLIWTSCHRFVTVNKLLNMTLNILIIHSLVVKHFPETMWNNLITI